MSQATMPQARTKAAAGPIRSWLGSLLAAGLAILTIVATYQFATAARGQPVSTRPGQPVSLAGYPAAAPSAHSASDGPKDAAEIDAFLTPLVVKQLDSMHIPGAQVAVVSDGRLVFAKGYGYADTERRAPATADSTVFRPGSIAKTFTWTAVMQLVEQGKLDLDADVNTYLTSFKIPATYPEPITLAHLLTHTAGFEEHASNGAIYVASAAQLQPLGTSLASTPPARIFPAGSRIAYSNYGAALAGHLIEQASGMPFEQYMAEHVLRPLEMGTSTFAQPLPSSLAALAATGYLVDDEGAASPQAFEYLQLAPGSGLSTTASDVAKFMIAHLQDGRFGDDRILQEATAQDMHRRHFASDPRLPGMAWGFAEGSQNGLRLLMHRGDTDLFHGNLVLLPDQNVGIYLVFNSVGGARVSRGLIDTFIDHYYPAATAAAAQLPSDFSARAALYTGTYQSTERAETTIDKLAAALAQRDVVDNGDGTLSVSGSRNASGETKRWAEAGQLLFQEVGGQSLLAFGKDETGHVAMLFDGDRPVEAYERLPWYGVQTTQMFGVIAALGLFASAVVTWPIGAAIGLFRRQGKRSNATERWARPLAFVAMLLLVGAIGGLLMTLMGDIRILNTSLPQELLLALGLGVAGAVATIGVVICAAMAWRTNAWGIVGRLHYTVIALAAVGIVAYLNGINMLGFRF